MVDAIPPATLAKWLALSIHDGWGQDNERTARICASVHNAIMVALSKSLAQSPVDDKDFRDSSDYLPTFGERKQNKATIQTPEQMMAIAKRITGTK